MQRFVQGNDRNQPSLLPASLEDYVDADNPVRVVEAFVEALDLGGRGFAVVPASTGRPSYHPATLLKLYIYGYLNRIQRHAGGRYEAPEAIRSGECPAEEAAC